LGIFIYIFDKYLILIIDERLKSPYFSSHAENNGGPPLHYADQTACIFQQNANSHLQCISQLTTEFSVERRFRDRTFCSSPEVPPNCLSEAILPPMDERGRCYLRRKPAGTIIFRREGVPKNEEEVSGVEETLAGKGKGAGRADWYRGGVAGG
jgi:hypothetical protein